ncbi:hypothetical protein JS562_53205, partial [Agrobacterium sp. S2]|nr:hypothetical protein [Agrobacterium sp. S2]
MAAVASGAGTIASGKSWTIVFSRPGCGRYAMSGGVARLDADEQLGLELAGPLVLHVDAGALLERDVGVLLRLLLGLDDRRVDRHRGAAQVAEL